MAAFPSSSLRWVAGTDARPGTPANSAAAPAGPARMQGFKAVADLEADAYRHRMRVNFFAAGFLIILMGAGMFIANAMVDTQKAHGCYTSGQRSCSLI